MRDYVEVGATNRLSGSSDDARTINGLFRDWWRLAGLHLEPGVSGSVRLDLLAIYSGVKSGRGF